jgi:hypothetical protein
LLVAAAALHSARFDRRHDVPRQHAAIGAWRP